MSLSVYLIVSLVVTSNYFYFNANPFFKLALSEIIVLRVRKIFFNLSFLVPVLRD